ncbi:mannose-1-phosphate guanylyltransferase/mannose-6-phosphate isomerase [Polaromonas sp. JS666]|uniref:mannose-1-phosphate guanylyltransferase/mannose-6-phosphate isomerase n=1 Tax=Polaromonas sp. (strain JS666 / ATCC BAA-500) TaxID=296591 RepID=UPI0000464385|nr:mannose-1-phosphate guanylyltransferase/mannose-6-phosphate isomerase [Polaromonas sp. JS666]ABE46816.1 mannose-1-phosphate guanylyltransferase (GDP) [Polaromonas sp. JS666]
MLIPVILCGGAGSRLWPVSRELHPKPFMRLADGQSLLQKAFQRGAHLPGVKEILTVTNRELFFKTEDEYRPVNPRGLLTSFLLEPFGRNTAAAVAAAALQVQRTHGDGAVLLVLPADHLIADQAAFADAVVQARALAEQGRVVTFGIRPEGPETGFGYIEAEGHDVKRFVEKPDLETARQYLASGRYWWNSGMFCFTAGAMLAELEQHCPRILAAARKCLEQSRTATGKGLQQTELDAESFAEVPDDSIDYAVMEKTRRISMVPCALGWSDIGSWTAVGELSEADGCGNRVQGHALMHDTTDCYIQSQDRLVGTVGVADLIIIDTPDALLVANRHSSQNVKQIYAQLKTLGHDAHKVHRTVHRPWGTYTVLEEGPQFKIKRIEVKPGAALSLQMHHHRSEHWIVVSGTASIVNGEQDILLLTNQSTYIPAGHKHRLINPGVIDLVMIEVQSGAYLGEDDIVRFEDDYGRV